MTIHPGTIYPGTIHPETIYSGTIYPGKIYPGTIHRESRNFHTDECWQNISALKAWWQASKVFVVRVEPAADLSKAFHIWIGKTGSLVSSVVFLQRLFQSMFSRSKPREEARSARTGWRGNQRQV